MSLTDSGTPQFKAPEIGNGNKYTLKVDVFSLGITLFYLFCRTMPIKDKKKDAYVAMDDN